MEDTYFINGGNPLRGEVSIDTSKNALLPILAACILVDGVITLTKVPKYKDVLAMCDILQYMGATVKWQDDRLELDMRSLSRHDITTEQASKLRASIFMFGPLLGRHKKAKLAYPGGCDIGLRPIDLHINGIRQLNAKVVEKNGFIYADGSRMKAGEYILDFPSVGATENIMMAAVLTKGTTRIFNPAKEPEIIDLQNFLNACGAKIYGGGCNMIVIEGVKALKTDVTYQAISDRIVAGTFLIGTLMCGGDVLLKNTDPLLNQALIAKLRESACQIDTKHGKIRIRAQARPKTFGEVETAVYPGMPTDLQPQIMALQSISDGTCILVENLFESRFKHVPELIKMNANIKFKGSVCVITGKETLYGAEVSAPDLRGGAGLVLAGLVAKGYTTIHDVHYIDRGYFEFEQKLQQLGADIVRLRL